MQDQIIILSIGIAVLAIFAAVFIYRTTVVFGIGEDINVDDGTLFVNVSDNRVGVKNKTPGFTLDVSGDVNSTNKLREGGFALIPFGTIVMWTGSTAPSGWALCDGTNGTPDLRGRFVLSQGQGSGLTNRLINQVGGAETHTLTVQEMPSHTHTGTTASNGSHDHTGSTGSNGSHLHTGTTALAGTHTHTVNDPGHIHTQTTVNDDYNNSGTYPNLTKPSYPNYDSSGTNTWTDTINSSTTGITINSAGEHSHTFTTSTVGTHTHSISTDGSHNHTFTTNSTGGGQAHNNMPPFYALAYIMKL
jgi:microcystin-dependent protein